MLNAVLPVGPNAIRSCEISCLFLQELYPELNINVVAPIDVLTKINRDPKINYVDENVILDKKFIQNIYVNKYKSNCRFNWYYQQFLKYECCNYFDNYDRYVVIDGDTVFLRRVEFFKDGKYLFNRKTENHKPYFETIQKILPNINVNIDSCYGHSFISEYMIFDVQILKEMLSKIGDNWIEKILDNIDSKDVFNSGFSEYETYGTYMFNYYKDKFENINLKTNRCGEKTFKNKKITVDSLKKYATETKMDTISFETWC